MTERFIRKVSAHQINDATDESDVPWRVKPFWLYPIQGNVRRIVTFTDGPRHCRTRKSAFTFLLMIEIEQMLLSQSITARAMTQFCKMAFKGVATAFKRQLHSRAQAFMRAKAPSGRACYEGGSASCANCRSRGDRYTSCSERGSTTCAFAGAESFSLRISQIISEKRTSAGSAGSIKSILHVIMPTVRNEPMLYGIQGAA